MSLFNDEDGPPPPRTRFQIWRRRIFYAVLMFCAFLWVTLRILMNLGGNSAPLKSGLEDYLRGATGMRTQINHFNYMKFYPNVSIDMADIDLFDPATKPGSGLPVANIGSVKSTLAFWSVIFPSGHVREFTVRDIDLKNSLHLPRPLYFDKFALEKTGSDGKPALILTGRYGADALNGTMAMNWTDEPGGRGYFQRPENGPFAFTSPFLTAQGTLSIPPGGGFHLTFGGIGFPDKMLTGTAVIERASDGYIIKADLKGGGSEIILDLRRAGDHLTGSLRLPVFDTADMKIAAALRGIYGLLAPTDAVAPDFKLDFDVRADDVRVNGAKMGKLSFPLTMTGGVLTAGPLKGTFSGGGATGQLTLDGSKKSFDLVVKALVKDMKYGILQKAVTGRESVSGTATLDVSLTSAAADSGDLLKNLKGEVALVAGEGDLVARMLDPWGKGLIDVMLPKLNPSDTMRLNCLIADLKFSGGVAKTDPLFLDSDRLTIAGDGTITTADPVQIDIELTPKPKDPVFLSTVVNMRIKGPLADPQISPDNVPLGKKAGSLLPGAVNPAFLAFSLTDLGLTDKHPCHAFIGKTAP